MQYLRDAKNRYGFGIKKIDECLGGGLVPNNFYLLLGECGSGRTTLGLQFLIAGLKKNQKGLLITFAENRSEIQKIADAHQLKLKKIEIIDYSDFVRELKITTEVKVEEIVNHLIHHIQSRNPDRLVIDVMSFFRALHSEKLADGLLIWLREACVHLKATTLLIDKNGVESNDMSPLAHGILRLASDPNAVQFTFDIPKLRGLNTSGQIFNLKLGTGGFEIVKDES